MEALVVTFLLLPFPQGKTLLLVQSILFYYTHDLTQLLRRRPIRRMYISTLQAPSTPPPTIPLPALPQPPPPQQQQQQQQQPVQQQHFRPTNLNTPTRSNTAHTKVPSISTTSARARGLSVSSSTLDGDEHRIDENMKEN